MQGKRERVFVFLANNQQPSKLHPPTEPFSRWQPCPKQYQDTTDCGRQKARKIADTFFYLQPGCPYGSPHHNVFLLVPFPLGLSIEFTSSFILTRQSVTYTQDSSSTDPQSWSCLSRFPLDWCQYIVSFIICVGKALSYQLSSFLVLVSKEMAIG